MALGVIKYFNPLTTKVKQIPKAKTGNTSRPPTSGKINFELSKFK